jgi:hypothetical protein
MAQYARFVATFALALGLAKPAMALDHVVMRRGGKETEVNGRLVVTAQDGGLLLLARDGVLWAVPPEEQVKRTTDATPFHSLTRDEMSRRLLAELPAGFEVYKTAHYLILHDTSPAFARWCGSLFEGLYRNFRNLWTYRGVQLTDPEFPLVAIVFADRQAYMKHARVELGAASESVVGYYAMLTNRMTMYDLTGFGGQAYAERGHSDAQIGQILAQPGAAQTVSTIVHEATHQIAFNCGLHTRLSDCPVWFSEGIAVYFETPDLRSGRGGNRVGAINQLRLERFLRYCDARPANSLETLVRDDERLHDPRRALDAYAEAWALTYFLLRQRTKEYVAYVRMLSQKKPLLHDQPAARLEEFRNAFGDLQKLDAELIKCIRRLH